MWNHERGFADLYIVFAKIDGEKFTAFIVSEILRGANRATKNTRWGVHGSSTTPIFLGKLQIPKENCYIEIGRGHIVAFNILILGRFTLGASCGADRNTCWRLLEILERTQAFGKQMAISGYERKTRRDWRFDFCGGVHGVPQRGEY